MLKNLSIKSRLIFVLAFLCLQLIAGAVIGLISLSDANDAMENIFQKRLVASAHINKAFRVNYRIVADLGKSINASPEVLTRYLADADDAVRRGQEAWDSYAKDHVSGKEKEALDKFQIAFAELNSRGLTPALAAFHSGDLQTAAALVHGPVTSVFDAYRDAGNVLINTQLELAKSEQNQAMERYKAVRTTCMLALACGLLMAAGIGTWLIRSIVAPVKNAVAILGGMAQGDLTADIEVRSGDEIGMLMAQLKKVNDSLSGIVNQVRVGSDAIHSASTEIAAGNHELSARTEQQAASLEETASSMEELTATVRQNADNAEQGNVLSANASTVAKKGGDVVSGVVRTMTDISESSKKIAEITAVIDSIAFQTNILALNAAVEAARAGEQGRGFAVVATEVRNLAHRSGDAAKQIKALIEESAAKVTEGTQQVALAGATMADIVQSVTRVSDIMTEISVASREQSAGIEQVGRAIVQMDQVTQQNAALVEEAAAAATAMQEEAAKLTEQVGVFRTAHCTPKDSSSRKGNRLLGDRTASPRALA